LNNFLTKQGLPLTAGKEMVVSENVAKAMKAFHEVTKKENLNALSETVDQVNALYRGLLTTGLGPLSISFQNRNIVGGTFQMITDGHIGPVAVAKGMSRAVQHVRGKGEGLKHLQQAIDSGAFAGMHFRMADVLGEAGAAAASRIPGKGSVKELLVDPLRRFFTDTKAAITPWGIRGVGKNSRAKLAAGAKPSLSVPAELGENLNNVYEFILRGGYFDGLVDAGYSYGNAARIVNKTHFNPKDLALFEKRVGRRGMMFYSWMRKSVPLTLRKLFERPYGAKGQAILASSYPQRAGGPVEGWTPSFLRERGGFPVSGAGKATNYLASLGLPTEDLNMLKVRSTLTETARRSGESFIANFNPLATAALYEFPSGRQAWSGRELKHLESRLAPYYQKATGQQMPAILRRLEGVGPWSRAIGEVGKWTDDRKSVAARALNITTGLRLSTYDPAKWRFIDSINALEADVAQDSMAREMRKMYVPEYLRGQAMPGTMQRLQRIREIQDMRSRLQP